MKQYEIPTMADYMTLKPISIHPDESVSKALGLMFDHGIHHLPVVEDEQLVGILSDRDLRKTWRKNSQGEMTLTGDSDLHETVSNRMSRPPICIQEGTSVNEGIKQMVQYQIGSLPVIDSHYKLVGIFTEADAVRYCLFLIERY